MIYNNETNDTEWKEHTAKIASEEVLSIQCIHIHSSLETADTGLLIQKGGNKRTNQ